METQNFGDARFWRRKILETQDFASPQYKRSHLSRSAKTKKFTIFAQTPKIAEMENQELQVLPIGSQDFEKIRRKKLLYVDKTMYLHKMVSTSGYCFLARPRRFGKSLFSSTLEAYFRGQKELFEGLYIASVEKEWIEYPVFRFDFTGAKYDEKSSVSDKLNLFLTYLENVYGENSAEKDIASRFSGVIQRAYKQTGKQVVIIVDEYEKPLVDNLSKENLIEAYRDDLSAFYSVLKSMDKYIRFAFLTGISKIGKLNVFSALNNPDNISLLEKYNGICGITEAELKSPQLMPYVERVAEHNKMTVEECLDKLRKVYDGYHFSEECSEGIYNPFSLLNAFASFKFRYFWDVTGTPTFLAKMVKDRTLDLEKVSGELSMSIQDLFASSAEEDSTLSMLYQTGYLTIESYDNETDEVVLRFPNLEVREGFYKLLLPLYLNNVYKDEMGANILNIKKHLVNGRANEFVESLRIFLSSIAYTDSKIESEAYFQLVLTVILKSLGLAVTSEFRTASGRIDILLQTKRFVYVMELKYNGSAEEALAQIETKEYGLQWQNDPERKMIKIGLNYKAEIRNIDKWVISD